MAKVKLNVEKVKELQVGEIKYKDLISSLEMDNKRAGDPRNAQLRELRQYMDIQHIKASRFIINEIYEEPVDKIDGRQNNKGGNNKTEYIEDMERLILELLVSKDRIDNKLLLSKSKLYNMLKIVNDNYSFCKNRQLKFSNFIKITPEEVNEWFESTDSMLKRNVESALNNISSKSLAFWRHETTICKIQSKCIDPITGKVVIDVDKITDEYDNEIENISIGSKINKIFREATDEEKDYILDVELYTMKNLGCKDKQDVVRKGLWSIFKDVVNEQLLKDRQILFYYNSYRIVYKPHEIKNYMYNTPLPDSIVSKYSKLNKDISDKINKNMLKRKNRSKDKCIETLGEVVNKNMEIRLRDSYEDNQNKLTKVLIDLEYRNICNDVTMTKINNA